MNLCVGGFVGKMCLVIMYMERYFMVGEVVCDIVIGMSDGFIVFFVLVVGLLGVVVFFLIVVIVGLVEVVVGLIVMGFGG